MPSSITEELRIGALDGAALVRERRTTQELVFEFLRDAILNGRLRGGAHLIQDKIATELNVSRVPVREALLQLESEGLVRMEAHRGATVVWLSPADIEEVFEIRAVLVAAAIRRVTPLLSDEQIEQLRALTDEMAKETNIHNRAGLTHSFFSLLFEDLRRPRLRAMIDKLECEVRRYLLAIPDRQFIGYSDVVQALVARNADGAAELMTRHLQRVCAEALRALKASEAADQARAPGQGANALSTPRIVSRKAG